MLHNYYVTYLVIYIFYRDSLLGKQFKLMFIRIQYNLILRSTDPFAFVFFPFNLSSKFHLYFFVFLFYYCISFDNLNLRIGGKWKRIA